MPTIPSPLITALFLLLAGLPSLGAAGALNPGPEKVIYLGNSLTALTHPAWQEELGRAAGVTWKPFAFLGAGWPSWMHLYEVERALGLRAGQPSLPTGSAGPLTLQATDVTPPHVGATQFIAGNWDGLVLQIFGSTLQGTTRSARGVDLTEPVQTGDIHALTHLIRHYLERNPHGRIYLYSVWPSMIAGEDRMVDGRWVRGAEFPLRDQFDYERSWLAPYPDPAGLARKAGTQPHRTRAYKNQVLAAVRTAFPDLAQSGRLFEIPGGDLLLNLERRMRRGELPGLTSVKDLYTDVQHLRAGLGHYAMTALFLSSLFPHATTPMSHQRFNEQAAYGEDVANDFGAVIPVTDERAAVVQAAIREVLSERGI